MFSKIEHLAAFSNWTGTRTQSSTSIRFVALMLLVSLSARSQVATAPTAAGGYDGPAALPRVLLQTTMADTPTPGITTTVNSGDNLQTALNNAKCGDTIELQAGATFSGIFTFPAKICDAKHWIIVRTNADDSLFARARHPPHALLCRCGIPAGPACVLMLLHEERARQIGHD